MIIAELYQNLSKKALFPRLEKTANFVTKDLEIDSIIGRLDPKSRNHLLNIGTGIEIEVENCLVVPGLSRMWEITEDPSLRNNGAEYRSRYGTRIYELWDMLRNFRDMVDTARKEHGKQFFDFSERTSIHVHLDVRNFTTDQLKNFIWLYILLENPLFKFADESRKHNVFCVPLRESNMLGRYEHIQSYLNEWSRYCALNLQSVSKFGTVEFRHMSGRSNPRDIYLWTLLLGLIQTAAWQYDTGQLWREIQELKSSSQYDRLLSSVFMGATKFLYWDPQDFDDAVSDAKLMISHER